MKIMTTTDAATGKPYLRIYDPEYDYSFGYYSNNMWITDRELVLSRHKKGDSSFLWEFARLNLDTKEWSLLPVTMEGSSNYHVHGEYLYYITHDADDVVRRFCRYDMSRPDAQEEVLYRQAHITFPHATADGRYFNWMEGAHDGQRMKAYRFDVQTGECILMADRHFSHPFPDMGHAMLSPTDPDMLFFCHEGITQYVSNRLWMQRLGEKPYNIAKQKLNADGDLGDCYGHECWAPDGKGLYFVKYSCAPEPPRGVCYVDAVSGEAELLFSKYPYWHVSCSPCGKKLASDTQSRGFSGVCLIDLATGEEDMPIQAATTWQHPCHPHPQYNFAGDRLTFHEAYEGNCAVGVLALDGIRVLPWN